MRRANEIATEGLPAASFKKSMQDLSAIAFLATLIALPALTIGLIATTTGSPTSSLPSPATCTTSPAMLPLPHTHREEFLGKAASVHSGNNVDFRKCSEDFLYATHGGTAFIVNLRGRVYALTCGHVFKDFDHGRLFITAEKRAKAGSGRPQIKAVYYPSSPREDAIGTDIVDICVIEFADDIGPDFFKGSVYVIDKNTVATSQPGHALLVSGVLKDWTRIVPEEIRIGYCRLQFHDAGVFTPDPVLRRAVSEFRKPKFENITGISGSLVFDQTANVLCGMVARGSMSGNNCEVKYIDIYDMIRVLL